jgi:hypothetical protein
MERALTGGADSLLLDATRGLSSLLQNRGHKTRFNGKIYSVKVVAFLWKNLEQERDIVFIS